VPLHLWKQAVPLSGGCIGVDATAQVRQEAQRKVCYIYNFHVYHESAQKGVWHDAMLEGQPNSKSHIRAGMRPYRGSYVTG